MRQIDTKYHTDGNIFKADGTPLPLDEPLMVFRGQDSLLPTLLDYYLQLCKEAGSPPNHLAQMEQYVEGLRNWQASHVDRVGTPD